MIINLKIITLLFLYNNINFHIINLECCELVSQSISSKIEESMNWLIRNS